MKQRRRILRRVHTARSDMSRSTSTGQRQNILPWADPSRMIELLLVQIDRRGLADHAPKFSELRIHLFHL
ncbi:MAG: hypothetical protein WBZ16_15005, partial [Pseudolabrys sp.]